MPKLKTAKELGVSAPFARHAMAYVLAGGRGSRLLELTDAQYKAHSLIRHLQRGWNFLRPELIRRSRQECTST
jgi:ADP-glucose pyrophosphorylase